MPNTRHYKCLEFYIIVAGKTINVNLFQSKPSWKQNYLGIHNTLKAKASENT